ncbi:phosphate ABC transporter permease subunit PstC [Rubrimonas cliftonensis]|uniref:Phosphate transport system permease protein n=1 Tax=Rubrimonas cliftonensis TaxID=89524 RepID=A0A1H4FJS7_9RHOB|nr:phosphate ABC transporter permease subunit PstC [Rubrimonas cliftonensis]SEA97546.1 phosphate ABC transporter membrane protein 1, PhoT family [Rubrimonas cliftonensis]
MRSSDKGADKAGVITRPPSAGELLANRVFRGAAYGVGAATLLLLAFIIVVIGGEALPAMVREGFGFLGRAVWSPGRGEFGIAAEIWGTLYSSILALIIAGVFGVAIAIFLTQDFLPGKVAVVFRTIIEMLAAIPSVVYGLWGIFVVIPAIRPTANWLHDSFGWFPPFSTSMGGPGLAPAVIVLAIMVLPTVAAISQDALRLIPYKVKEAAYGMGTTRWEAIVKVMLPTASGGIFASLVLGFGRALGETMALAMIIGNANQISWSLFAPANTLAALLASTFPEAGDIERGALMYAAVVLLALTLVVNMLGVLVMQFTSRQTVN